MIRMLHTKAKEMRDEEFQQNDKSGRSPKENAKRERQTAFDQLFERQEKIIIDQDKQITELETTLRQ